MKNCWFELEGLCLLWIVVLVFVLISETNDDSIDVERVEVMMRMKLVVLE